MEIEFPEPAEKLQKTDSVFGGFPENWKAQGAGF